MRKMRQSLSTGRNGSGTQKSRKHNFQMYSLRLLRQIMSGICNSGNIKFASQRSIHFIFAAQNVFRSVHFYHHSPTQNIEEFINISKIISDSKT